MQVGLQRYLLRVCPLARSPSQGKTPQETPYKAPQMLLKKGLGGVPGGWEGPLAGFCGQVGTPICQDDAKLTSKLTFQMTQDDFQLDPQDYPKMTSR